MIDDSSESAHEKLRSEHQVRTEPTLREVELIQVNPDYALVRLSNGKKNRVSLHHIVPGGETPTIFEPEAITIISNSPKLI